MAFRDVDCDVENKLLGPPVEVLEIDWVSTEQENFAREDEFLESSKITYKIDLTDTRVLIADDHDEVRASIRQLLDRTDGFAVVGEAVDGAQAVVEVGRLLPDLVIMDIFMPVMGGLQATRQIVQTFPAVRIVALTADPSMVMDALTAGAIGCLLKGDPAASLVAALKAACDSPADDAVSQVG